VALAGSAFAIRYAKSDPMEYDMRRVQSDRSTTADLQRAWSVCNDVLGASQGGMVVVADTADEARQLQEELDKRWAAAPKGAKPFKATRSLWSFVAKDQPAKTPTLLALGARLERAQTSPLCCHRET
jgi:hypothetical protein